MSKVKFITAAVCATAIATSLSAASKPAPVTLESVIKRVQQQQRKTQTLQADFKQGKELALLSKPEVSTGTFVFSKPNNVLWSYDAPKRVQMLISGGVLTTYYPDLNKVERIDVKRFEDRIFKYMGASGAIDELSRYFDFTFTDTSTSPYWVLDLSPKSRAVARRVKHIRIWIEKDTYLTSKFEYVESDGDITRYEFTKIKVNQPIEQGRFTLSLPANVKVEQMKIQ
ncbi:MAG TPA: outer membrane lipoprotein carrier protein LolA [Thermoanaerobaculia bacterium]|jgi:outer membrane lipoprotein-sorting protein|nr:outer membrane lipoprotein carrier protein LolA [Thermoanaerobaculia bacterium]